MNTEDKLRKLLREHPDGLRVKELQMRVKSSASTIRSALYVMPDAYIDRWYHEEGKMLEAVWAVVVPPANCPRPDLGKKMSAPLTVQALDKIYSFATTNNVDYDELCDLAEDVQGTSRSASIEKDKWLCLLCFNTTPGVHKAHCREAKRQEAQKLQKKQEKQS